MIRRKKRFRWTKALYRKRNHVERFFSKLKQFRRIATRYDKLGANSAPFLGRPTTYEALRARCDGINSIKRARAALTNL